MRGNRFSKIKKNINLYLAVPIIGFVLCIVFFYVGVTEMSSLNSRAQINNLDTSISRDIMHFYASKGKYPENIHVLEEHYGLTYDHNRFRIEYKYMGTNTLPEYEIICLDN